MTTIAYKDFIDEVRNDLKEFILDRWAESQIKDLDREEVYDEAFTADSVTGNGSGSYFFNAWKAKESIFNMDEDLLKETISEFDIDMSEHWGGWEYLDVSVRCYALGQIDIDELLDEIRKEIGTVFSKDEVMKVIANAREDWEEEGDEEYIITIDFFDNGIGENGFLNSKDINGRWIWCYEFDKEDYQVTDEKVFKRIKAGAEMNNIKIED